ncbi:hypothetical protein K438DRAFT_1798713, partial [Mycena galopus ATCC 62051]
MSIRVRRQGDSWCRGLQARQKNHQVAAKPGWMDVSGTVRPMASTKVLSMASCSRRRLPTSVRESAAARSRGVAREPEGWTSL